MTREEIAERLATLGYASVIDTGEVRRLADAVRALPVVATCRQCASCDIGPGRPSGPRGWGPGERRRLTDYCNADGWHKRTTDADAAPPSWCPLRGKR